MKYTKYYGYSFKEYDECKGLIDKANKNTIQIVSLIGCIVLAALSLVSLKMSYLEEFQPIYFIFAIIMVLFTVICNSVPVVADKRKHQIYIFMTIVFVFATFVAIENPGEKATVFPVFLALLPMLFIEQAMRMNFFIVGYTTIYCIVVYLNKNFLEASYDCFSAVVFGCMAILNHYFLNIKVLNGIVTYKNLKSVVKTYKKMQKELQMKAQRDPLTGLYNRETFIEFAKRKLDLAALESKGVILGILDVDRFKNINDTFGHQTGDEAIIKASEVLKGQLRNNDVVGRLGGDEFIFLLANIDTKETASIVSARILDTLNKIEITNGVYVNASIGLMRVEPGENDFDQIYYCADMALYRAKELGRNQFIFYEENDV